MNDLDTRLDAATKRRDTLSRGVQRIEGKLEAARSALKTLEADCRKKGVEPAEIDAVIDKLTTRYGELVDQIEQEIQVAEEALAPFLKENKDQ